VWNVASGTALIFTLECSVLDGAFRQVEHVRSDGPSGCSGVAGKNLSTPVATD
jgi:hypothetical protein